MRVAVASGKGGREYNEDSIDKKNINEKYCFALADGLGENGSGGAASYVAVQSVLDCFEENNQIKPETLKICLEAAQKNVLMQRSNIGTPVRTTIAILLTDGNSAVWAHCGDSRIYRLRKNKIQEVTEDHSSAFKLFLRDRMSYSDIRISPEKNKLLRMLGERDTFRPAISNVVSVGKKEAFLVCSDGFWEYVTEDFIEYAFKKSSSPGECLKLMLDERAFRAPENSDNFSAIVVYI